MGELRLTGLSIYPVKSLAGIVLQGSSLDRFGLQFDRRWMLVDEQGQFLSQRRLPRMALIQPQIEGDRLILRAPGQAPLALPLQPGPAAEIRVQVWTDSCQAQSCGLEADGWLSGFLGRACRLVYMPEEVIRRVDQEYAGPDHQTAFSDGFPLLLISVASLADLNGRLPEPLPMARFRPNLVVRGCTAYAEDAWSRIRIGGIGMRLVKPCSRCRITTIDPTTAQTGEEPLRTLATYRRRGNRVLFGQNLVHEGTGRLELGMAVELLEGTDG